MPLTTIGWYGSPTVVGATWLNPTGTVDSDPVVVPGATWLNPTGTVDSSLAVVGAESLVPLDLVITNRAKATIVASKIAVIHAPVEMLVRVPWIVPAFALIVSPSFPCRPVRTISRVHGKSGSGREAVAVGTASR